MIATGIIFTEWVREILLTGLIDPWFGLMIGIAASRVLWATT